MLGIDLNEDRFKFLYNIERKRQFPATEGSFRTFCNDMLDRPVQQQDRHVYVIP